MDRTDIELACIVNLYRTASVLRRQATMFSGSRASWRVNRAAKLDDIATTRFASLLAGSVS